MHRPLPRSVHHRESHSEDDQPESRDGEDADHEAARRVGVQQGGQCGEEANQPGAGDQDDLVGETALTSPYQESHTGHRGQRDRVTATRRREHDEGNRKRDRRAGDHDSEQTARADQKIGDHLCDGRRVARRLLG